MAEYRLTDNPDVVIRVSGGVPIPKGHRFWKEYEKWLAEGNTPDPYVPEPEPTVDEIYDQTIQNSKVVKAIVLAINDGSLVPGAGKTPSELKAIIKNKM